MATNPHLRDYVITLEGVLSADFCDEAIEKFESDSRKQEGKVISSRGAVLDTDIKSSTDLIITDLEGWTEVDRHLYESSRKCFQRYKNILNTDAEFLSGNTDEPYFIRRYDQGSGFYKPHADAVSPLTISRKLALIWYLNDVDAGGETEFVNFECKVQPIKGRAVLFPTDWMFAHRGHVPRTTNKYIARTFLQVR